MTAARAVACPFDGPGAIGATLSAGTPSSVVLDSAAPGPPPVQGAWLQRP